MDSESIFVNRAEAGKRLAHALQKYSGEETVVLALPRGGVVLGAEVAEALHAALGVVVVRKIGHPSDAEFALGAVADGQPAVYEQAEIKQTDKAWLEHAEKEARNVIHAREALYFKKSQPPEVAGKTVILVDDGIATGFTMLAALKAVRGANPARVIIAVPISSPEAAQLFRQQADEFVVLDNPDNFVGAVGAHYEQFDQVTDEEVAAYLAENSNNNK